MKVYIPFNMIVDIDSGIIRFFERYVDIPEYSINKLKSFLIHRKEENPITEYKNLRNIQRDISDDIYIIMMEKYYENVLKLSFITDILSFIINTHKLGFANELEITVGCNNDIEINHFKHIVSSLEYTITTSLNSKIKLSDYDYIFIKYLDEYYLQYLLNNKINGKRLYVANYGFNTILDKDNNDIIIDPILHIPLESEGNVVSLISIYNKK